MIRTTVLTLVLASPLFSSANGMYDDSTKTRANEPVKTPSAQWKKADDQITGKIAKPQLANMKATTERLHVILQDSSLAATGLKPIWHGEYAGDKTATGEQLNYGIYCDFTTAADGDATTAPATLSITVNDLSSLTGHMQINHQDVMTMPVVTAVRNECPYYRLAGDSANHTIWLVTSRPDVLPYAPISRKEYLQMVIADLNAAKARIVAQVKDRVPVRSAEEEAASKKRDLDELNTRYSGSELELRVKMYNEQYVSDADYQKANIDKACADVDTTLHFVEGMMTKLAPSTLAAPAIVSPNSTEFEGFRDGEPGMVMLVRNNPTFWQPGAAAEKPQFFVISWNSASGDAIAQSMNNQITQNLDTRSLKAILAK